MAATASGPSRCSPEPGWLEAEALLAQMVGAVVGRWLVYRRDARHGSGRVALVRLSISLVFESEFTELRPGWQADSRRGSKKCDRSGRNSHRCNSLRNATIALNPAQSDRLATKKRSRSLAIAMKSHDRDGKQTVPDHGVNGDCLSLQAHTHAGLLTRNACRVWLWSSPAARLLRAPGGFSGRGVAI